MLTDYEKAKKVTPEQLKQRKEWLCKKHGITTRDPITNEIELNTWRKLKPINVGEYFENLEKFPRLEKPEFYPSETYRHAEQYEKAKKRKKEKEKSNILIDHSLIEVSTAKSWRCGNCNLEFHTTIDAMARHSETHARNDPIKIYKTESRRGDGVFRPQEHQWNSNTGKYFEGSDAKITEVRVPDNMRDGVDLICPKCREYRKNYEGAKTERGKASRVGHFMSHIKECKGTASTGNVPMEVDEQDAPVAVQAPAATQVPKAKAKTAVPKARTSRPKANPKGKAIAKAAVAKQMPGRNLICPNHLCFQRFRTEDERVQHLPKCDYRVGAL
jgi:hypothetical protein